MKNTNNDLLKRIEQYAREHSMLECTDIVIGYSGGADSSLLLYALSNIANKNGIRLTAAHVNHMLRGEEADRDEEFCRKACKDCNVPFRSLRVDVAALSREQSLGTEECARNIRYDFFAEIKKELEKNGAKVHIATAHNATDNAETVIFNLVRGTAITGLCGIPPKRDGYVVRPILFLSKEEVLDYCDKLKIKYVTDKTNSETVYTRNRIRHNVLGELRMINPSIESSVFRATETLRRDAEYLDTEASTLYGSVCKDGSLQTKELLSAHPALRSRVICLFFDAHGAGYERTHIETCDKKIGIGDDFSLSLTGKKKAVMQSGYLRVEADTREKAKKAPDWEIPLSEGENILPDGAKLFLFSKKEDAEKIKTQNVYKLFIQQTLSGDTIDNVFVARNRREGDVIKYGGHSHKVKKLLSEHKIPAAMRNDIPILERGGTIVWIAGVRCADREADLPNDATVYAVYAKM